MVFTYECRICGEKLSGKSRNGLVIAAERHYTNQHNLQHETDVEPTSIELDEKTIREDIEEE